MGSNMIGVHRAFRSVTNPTFGWGTTFTNDFMGCVPGRSDLMRPISLVCKVKSANGRPAIKLSDNYAKATGPAEEIDRYRRVFGSAGMDNAPAIVSTSDLSRNIPMARNKLLIPMIGRANVTT